MSTGDAIRMGGPDESAAALTALEERVRNLEALYGLIDLLALPGLLMSGAAQVFDATQSAETIPAQATGFYAKEVTSGGVALRWTKFPQPGLLDVAVLATIPFVLELRALNTPHVQSADDLEIVTSEGDRIAFGPASYLGNGVLQFSGVLLPKSTGLLRLSISSTTCLEGAGDWRKLGLPYVQMRCRPNIGAVPSV
jgi:hypothetical protein